MPATTNSAHPQDKLLLALATMASKVHAKTAKDENQKEMAL
jgi:hypothetical protein